MAELTIYGEPELVTSVRPGQVLEALPGSKATAIVHGSEPSEESPTKVFGYVRGDLNQDSHLGDLGTTIVERILPSGRHSVYGEACLNGKLMEWAPKGKLVYFLIGEIKNGTAHAERSTFKSDSFRDNGITLDWDILKDIGFQLIDFAKQREQKDYLFRTPNGETYSLNEIVLSLEENK